MKALVQYAAVVRKETRQTVRDKRIMVLLVMAPLLQTIVFGVAVDLSVDRVKTLIVDRDPTSDTTRHARRLLADGTLIDAGRATSASDIERALDSDAAHAAVVLTATGAQLVLDGSDPLRSGAAAAAAVGYFTQGPSPVIARVFYNPRLETRMYMVPGILGMLLVVVTTIVTAMGLARERESGTLEQVLVTPIRPLTLLAGKMTPFVFIGLLDVLLVLTAATWIFAIPIRGSLVALSVGTLFFLCSTLGVGLFISTMSATQQQAFLGGFLFVLPAALLSGIMTPIHAMPEWMQWATVLNPLRFFAALVRSVLLRGAGGAEQWPNLLALAIYGAAILTLATLRFRRRLA